jgi:hypothetical protein
MQAAGDGESQQKHPGHKHAEANKGASTTSSDGGETRHMTSTRVHIIALRAPSVSSPDVVAAVVVVLRRSVVRSHSADRPVARHSLTEVVHRYSFATCSVVACSDWNWVLAEWRWVQRRVVWRRSC